MQRYAFSPNLTNKFQNIFLSETIFVPKRVEATQSDLHSLSFFFTNCHLSFVKLFVVDEEFVGFQAGEVAAFAEFAVESGASLFLLHEHFLGAFDVGFEVQAVVDAHALGNRHGVLVGTDVGEEPVALLQFLDQLGDTLVVPLHG